METDRASIQGRVGRSRWRRICFHCAAALLAFFPLVAIELALRACVPPVDSHPDDSLVSFAGIRPLFVPDPTGTRFAISEERLAFFRRQSFEAVKPANTIRIFVLGGSTVQGRPYSVETAFPKWLELNLRAAESATNWQVINCGGVSYASYRLVPILQEILQYEPGLIVLYTGHNEFLEDRAYDRLKRAPPRLIRLHRALLRLRTYALADRWLSHGRGPRRGEAELPVEVRARLDFEDGLASYRRDDERRRATVERFERNLDTMVRLASEAGVPLVLMNPVANLRDCPPFKSEHRSGLSERQTARVAELMDQASTVTWEDVYGKLRLLGEAAAIDGRHAGLLYRVGLCHHRIGRTSRAKEWFVRAKEQDVCPLRILESMHAAIREVAMRYRVPLVDVRALVERRTPDGIPGEQWLLDHVHPTIEGHRLVADELLACMERMGILDTDGDWQATRDELRRMHLATLDETYFAHGLERLQRLRAWSRGRIPEGKALPAPQPDAP
jgi:hypothetical protein